MGARPALGFFLWLTLLGALAPSSPAQAGVMELLARGCRWGMRQFGLERASPPPAPAVDLYLALKTTDARRINVFDVPELAKAAESLATLISDRDELRAFRPRIVDARREKKLTYRELLTLVCDCAKALSPGETTGIETADKQIDTLLASGVAVLPVIQDGPMAQKDLLEYRAAFVYPYQLVSKPTKADGAMKSPWAFLYHDHLHSALMFAKDGDDGLLNHLARFPDAAAKRRWLDARAGIYGNLLRGLEKLPDAERDVARDVLFELLHEWPPERRGPAESALRDLNRLGLTNPREVARGLLAQKSAAARYLVPRMDGVSAPAVERALTWIAGNLR